VDVLSDQLCELLGPHAHRRTPTNDTDRDFANLVEELQRLLGDSI
jgi:hypothetical protein